MVVMSIEAFERREQILKLRAKVLQQSRNVLTENQL